MHIKRRVSPAIKQDVPARRGSFSGLEGLWQWLAEVRKTGAVSGGSGVENGKWKMGRKMSAGMPGEAASGPVPHVSRPRVSEFRGDHGKKGSGRRISFKNNMPNAGIPNIGQDARILAYDDDEAFRLRLEEQKIFRPAAVHDNDAVDE